MTAVKTLSFRTKLSAGLGLGLALSLVLAIVLIGEMGSVNAGGTSIAADSVPRIELIDRIQSDQQAYRADQLWNIANTDLALAAAPINALHAVGAQIQLGFQLYRSMTGSAADAHLLALALARWDAYVRATLGLDLVSSSTTQPPVAALANSSAITFAQLAPTITALVRLDDTLARGEANGGASAYRSARTLGIVLLVIALIVGAATIHVIRRRTDELPSPTDANPETEITQEFARTPGDDVLYEGIQEVVIDLRTMLEQLGDTPDSRVPVAAPGDPVSAPPEPVSAPPEPVSAPPAQVVAVEPERADQIAETIAAIAGQSNRLALSAAVQAARTGEQGHGLGVLAEEVRSLADETQLAAQEISALIESIERDPSGHEMAGRVEQIAAASQQIRAGARSIRVTARAGQSSAAVVEVAASAAALAENAEALTALVTYFRV